MQKTHKRKMSMLQVRDFIGREGEDYQIHRDPNLPAAPSVSVLMPTYCRGDNGLLKRAVESVLAQTYEDFELIVIDDGSVDMTREIIRYFRQKDPRLVYIRNRKNSGLPAIKVMQGYLCSRGRYIAYQFDDDQWKKDALAHMVAAIEEESEDAFAYGACEYIKKMEGKSLILGTESVTADDIFHSNTIPNNTVIHPRELFEKYGAYDPHLFMRRLTDWDLWMRWTASGVKAKHIDKILSVVEEQRDGSLFSTLSSDLALMRILQSRNLEKRNLSLNTDHYLDYEIDDLSFIEDPIKREKMYSSKLLPFYERQADLLRRKAFASFAKGEVRPHLLVVKDFLEKKKDTAVDLLLIRDNPYFTTSYMPSEHLAIDSDVMDFADGSLIIGKGEKLGPREWAILESRPYLRIKEKEMISAEQIDRQMKVLWRECGEEPAGNESDIEPSILSEAEIKEKTQHNLSLEEQRLKIQRLERTIEKMLGFMPSEDSIREGSSDIPFNDLSQRVQNHNRYLLSRTTKLLHHLTGENRRQGKRYLDLVQKEHQRELLQRGCWLEFSPYLTEKLELRYHYTPKSLSRGKIQLYTTNQNPMTPVILAAVEILTPDNRLIARVLLRGTDIRHYGWTDISLPEIGGGSPVILTVKGENQVASCAVSVLEWKKRNIFGRTVYYAPFED